MWSVDKSEMVKVGRFDIVVDQINLLDKNFEYSYVKIRSGVCILPVLGDKVIVLKQYRHTSKTWEWELPAGMIDDGEDSLSAAKRELKEETGFIAGQVVSLGEVHPSGGSTDETVYLYYAECKEKDLQELDHSEYIEMYELTYEELLDLILSGKMKHAIGISCVMRYHLMKNSL